MDDDTPLPTPAPPPSPLSKEPTELQKLRFDYAWKWFNFHAEQRTKMFNFMLVGLGILATALVGAIEKKLLLEAAVVGTAATMVALVFSLLDARNRQLYIAAMDVLIDAEKNLVFGDGVKFKDHNGQDKDFGISRRIALEEGADKSKWRGWREGRHRHWMPALAYAFALLFALAALRAWWVYFDSVGKPPEASAQVCCQWIAPAPATPASAVAVSVPASGSSDGVTLDGTARMQTRHWAAMWIGLALVGAGVAALALGHRLAGGAAVAGGIGVSLLSGLSIPLSFHVDPKFEARLADRIELRVESLLKIARGAEPGLLAAERFGGFDPGGERFECDAEPNSKALAGIKAGISLARERRQGAVVLLVGGTDRSALSPPLRARFESNSGLARARVDQVERCLGIPAVAAASAPSSSLEVVRVITGPSYTPSSRDTADLAAQKMAQDREVKAFVISVPTRKP